MDLTNKKKIVNDPVHGFINIQHPLVFDLIEHPFFQRLRNIRQLGLTYLVYPGANHTRFQHALGAVHLMTSAITVLRSKGHHITDQEAEAATVAILLHDIGHGPFSHSLEYSIAHNVNHETISRSFMAELNKQMDGKLTLAISVFEDTYHKRFLHQLVSSQLDMDRLDYLRRDSFFSGVTEGTIGSERIIKMLDTKNDELVVEAKGIYSIEKFLIARRLMYWQVYLHKTVVVADQMLIRLMQRARELAQSNHPLFGTPSLLYFLSQNVTEADFFAKEGESATPEALLHFANIDDNDIMVAVKQWVTNSDPVLSALAKMLINRRLLKIEYRNAAFDATRIEHIKSEVAKHNPSIAKHVDYFVYSDSVSNNAYCSSDESIKILYNNGELVEITEASDMLNTQVLSKEVKKYFFCYPKELRVN
ncbi:MAG: HD domain-containing protein [Bacteroidales bacterium]|nr:HD domain-containing protein [Bacteroidales bacterium]MBN2748422.1 HD domain-containing protein [Bacteroidales bacterium]